MARGETVKYVIDADTSGFARGMGEAAVEADLAGRRIDRSLTSTNKRSENNFRDIRRNAGQTASQIRSFGTALQGFRDTSIIIGITALTGATLELAGAFAAAGSTASIIVPLFAQGGAAVLAYKEGVFGLSDAFKAVAKNDPKAFKDAMVNLGPAAQQVAYGVAGLNKAFNSIRLNTQQALLSGVGKELLRLGAIILPTVNAGLQTIGRAMNGAFNQAAQLAEQPIFSGLLATIFADTAHNITILSGALAPLLTIFTNLYLVTRPYVSLLAQTIVNLLGQAAAYLSTVRGQTALNIAIQEGIVAIVQLGKFVGAVFGFLTAVFRTSINSGTNLIGTLTGLVQGMTDFVNSAQGQKDLISLFNFTSLVLRRVAGDIGLLLQGFFDILNAIDSLNPQVQTMVVNFLAFALAVEPVGGYFLKLFSSIKLVAVTIFNLAQQARLVFVALGAMSSTVLLLAGGLIVLGAIIKGPLGGALMIVGGLIAAYIGLSFLLAQVSQAVATTFWEESIAAFTAVEAEIELAATQGVLAQTMIAVAVAGEEAGAGLGFAATAAEFLQAALIPLLVLAAGVLVILSMLGLFSSKGKQAQGTSIGLGNSLGGLSKSMRNVGTTGNKAATTGLSPLSDALNNVGDAAAGAQGQLASFDKMNVLTDNSALGAGAGIPNVPALPDVGGLGGGAMGVPPLDTGAFDKSLADMQKNFEGLKSQLGAGVPNPFAAIGEWINAHPWIALTGFIIILGVIIALFATGAVTIGLAALPLTLIVLGIIAIIAIIILLVNNWSTVWATISGIVSGFGDFVGGVFRGIFNFIGGVLTSIGDFFTGIFNGIVAFVQQWGITILAVMFLPFSLLIGLVLMFKDQINAVFTAIWNFIVAVFTPVGAFFANVFNAAWNAVKVAFSFYIGFFQGLWSSLMGIFAPVASFFGSMFSAAWGAIQGAFSAVGGFFQGIWNQIVSIFGSVGVAVGNAIGGAVRAVVNAVVNTVSSIVNNIIDIINGAMSVINHIPGVHIGVIGHIALPHLARGGVINTPTTALIGEAGAEAVMPLENNTGWIDQLADKINSANGSGNGQPIHLTVQIGEDKVATKIIDLINERTQMSGRNSILI